MKNKIYLSETIYKNDYPPRIPVRVIGTDGIFADGYITSSEKKRIIERAKRHNKIKKPGRILKRWFNK